MIRKTMAKPTKLEENKIYCVKCDEPMKLVSLPSYEFEEGTPLHNVRGYKCFKAEESSLPKPRFPP